MFRRRGGGQTNEYHYKIIDKCQTNISMGMVYYVRMNGNIMSEWEHIII